MPTSRDGSPPTSAPVTTTYLEQWDRRRILPARAPGVEHTIDRVSGPAPEFARFLYATVGADWAWTDTPGR